MFWSGGCGGGGLVSFCWGKVWRGVDFFLRFVGGILLVGAWLLSYSAGFVACWDVGVGGVVTLGVLIMMTLALNFANYDGGKDAGNNSATAK